jgi:agmatine deiminase
MPAEWEPHKRVWVAWPMNESDWPGRLQQVRTTFAQFVSVVSRSERVAMVCPNRATIEEASEHLTAIDAVMNRISYYLRETDRNWLRDSFPTAVWRSPGALNWIDWKFTGWARYTDFNRDQALGSSLADTLCAPIVDPIRPDNGSPLALEGGCIESNGGGILLTTEQCLLSKLQQRNPDLDRRGYESAFEKYLGTRMVVFLGSGCAGDDTNGHVDNVARFTSTDTVLVSYESNERDENHEPSHENLRRLLDLTTVAGRHLNVIPIPFPDPIIVDGERLPASYANFYISNNTVVVPTFDDRHDSAVLEILAQLFPDREITGVCARDLIVGGGAFHCLTQPEPE